MTKSAVNQFDTTPGNNTDVDGVGVGTSMTVDNTNDAFQHLMALIAQQMGEVGALSADIASAATTDLSTARGWFVNITGTNTISAFGTVPAGKIFRLRFVNGLTLTYNVASMILPNATSFSAAAGDIVTMLSLGTGNWRFIDYSPAGGGQLPPGTIVDFGGTTAPTGWLLCNLQAVSRTGYPLLFAAIGTAYGAGDGSTTFNVPDFRGRVAVGNDTMGMGAVGRITTFSINTPSTNGGVGGAEGFSLTAAELPSHNHTFSASSSTSVDGVHTHPLDAIMGGSGTLGALATGNPSANETPTPRITTQASGAHTHTVSISGTTSSIGSGAAHNNMQPSLIVMKIIKF